MTSTDDDDDDDDDGGGDDDGDDDDDDDGQTATLKSGAVHLLLLETRGATGGWGWVLRVPVS